MSDKGVLQAIGGRIKCNRPNDEGETKAYERRIMWKIYKGEVPPINSIERRIDTAKGDFRK